MAVDPLALYPGRIDNSDPTGYPLGKFQNESAPAANDGTPSDVAWGNDMNGFHQALLAAASIVASGTPDKVGASQYLTALQTLFADIADGRFPTSDQKAALAGTNGTPSAANKYVTDSDSRLVTSIGMAVAEYDLPSGTSGSALSNTVWNNAPLNTLAYDDIGASIQGGNLLRLPAGTYLFDGFVSTLSGDNSDSIVSRVYDATAASELFKGSPSAEASSTADDGGCVSTFSFGKVVLGTTTDLQLDAFRRIINSGGGGMIFGPAMTTGTNEVFGRLRATKVA